MATEKLSLKSLLVPSKEAEVEFPGMPDFKLKLSYLSREVLVSMRKKATRTTYKNRNQSEEIDDKLFLQLYVQAAIKGWSGLKLSYLKQLIPVDIGSRDENSELDYDEDTALDLMKGSVSFDSFVSETVSDLANFN